MSLHTTELIGFRSYRQCGYVNYSNVEQCPHCGQQKDLSRLIRIIHRGSVKSSVDENPCEKSVDVTTIEFLLRVFGKVFRTGEQFVQLRVIDCQKRQT